MIDNGRIVFADTMDAFNNYVEPHSMLIHFGNMPASAELEKIEGVIRVELLTDRSVRVYFEGKAAITEGVVVESVRQGWRLQEISLEKNSVEEIFKQLSKQSSQ
jgi:ABC-2 type transport system ATP-binding protein